MARSLRGCMIAMALALVVTACGGGAGSSSSSDSSDVEDATEAAASSDADVCGGTELSFTNHETGVSGTATSALASIDSVAGNLMIHAADFEIEEGDLSSWRPDIPEGNNVITVTLTVFNPEDDAPEPEEGMTLELTTEMNVVTFLLRHFSHDEDWSQTQFNDDTFGELTLTTFNDEMVCFDLDFQDDVKSASGRVEARRF